MKAQQLTGYIANTTAPVTALIVMIGIVITLLLLIATAYAAGFRYVMTASVPIGIYRRTYEPIAKGKYIEFCLPPLISKYGQAHGYVMEHGECPDGSKSSIKKLEAMAGDTVRLVQENVRVNDLTFANSRTQPSDSQGRLLGHMPFGQYVVKKDDLWVFSFYAPNSWDSRYYGPIQEQDVISTMAPVWTW